MLPSPGALSPAVVGPALAWVSVRHLQHMVLRGREAGLPMDELLQEAGITPVQMAEAEGLVPLLAVELLLVHLSRRHAGVLLGLHLAQDIQPATFGVLGYILQSCSTLGEVLEVLVRYNGLLSNIGRTSLRHGPGTVEVVWECLAGGEAFRWHATDYVLGIFAVLSRLLLPAATPLLRAVSLTHARPSEAARLAEYSAFFGAPVYFGAGHSGLLLTAEALRLSLPHGDAALRELMEAHAGHLLQRRGQVDSLADVVARLLRSMLQEGMPMRAAVAGQLGLSERSLHRRLGEQGTNYREILDAVRRDVTVEKLRNGRASVVSIAAELGFSTHQAFLRWFRQHFRMTPGEFRKSAIETTKTVEATS